MGASSRFKAVHDGWLKNVTDPLPTLYEPSIPKLQARGALRFCRHREPPEQERQIVCLIERPQCLQGGVGSLLRPALAHVAAEFPFHFGSIHWPFGETRGEVHFARNSLPVGEDRRHARGSADPCREIRV